MKQLATKSDEVTDIKLCLNRKENRKFSDFICNAAFAWPASQENFDAELKAAGSQLVVVDFFATWCGPCVHFAPKFAELSEKYKDCVFVKVDVDENDKTAQDQKISAMPTFKLYKNGSEVGELVGASEAKLVELIEKHRS